MDKLRQEIDKIVGCNSEVTNDTHNELCTQIYELVEREVKLFATPDVSESFSKEDLVDLGGWFDGSPEFVEEVVNDWLNARQHLL